MLQDEVNIELVYRLRAMNRILDRIVLDSHDKIFEDTIEVILEAVAQQRLSDAATILEDVLESNRSWLRGHLLLATIYQCTEQFIRAITTLGQGLNICVRHSRLLRTAKSAAMDKRFNGLVVQQRLGRSAERFKRYEAIFRHRMAMLQIYTGHFDDALDNLVALEGERSV